MLPCQMKLIKLGAKQPRKLGLTRAYEKKRKASSLEGKKEAKKERKKEKRQIDKKNLRQIQKKRKKER